jgi:predicted permease
MITIIGIYLFIVIGFIAKKKFPEIHEKSFVIMSVYFLQPFLTLWGLMLKPINLSTTNAPLSYLSVIFISFIFTFTLAKLFFKAKNQNIVTITSLVGNTGNLGIPLSLALFGSEGAFWATIINISNVLFIYSFAIFFYAGKFNIENAKRIFKIPIIWVGILAVILNSNGVVFNSDVMKILQMGAFSSMVIQLIIFGIYTANIKIHKIDKKLSLAIVFEKFIILPIVGSIFLHFLGLNSLLSKVVLLEVMVPIAVSNVNLAALFDTEPEEVAWLVILTSILFIPYFIFIQKAIF